VNELQATTLTPAEALAIRQAAAAIQQHQRRCKAAGKQSEFQARESMNLVLRLVNYADDSADLEASLKYENQPVTA